MANIVITSSVNTLTIVANDYEVALGTPCLTINKTDIRKIYIGSTSEYCVIELQNTKDFTIDLLGHLGGSPYRSLKIDTIDGVAPTSIQHIHDLFVTLKN